MNIPPQRLRVVLACALVFSLVLLAGCGKGKKNALSLSGKVTYKGQPVTGGKLTLAPLDGKTTPLTISISPDGSYMVTPPALGELQVAIETESIKGQSGMPYPNMPKGGGPAWIPPRWPNT